MWPFCLLVLLVHTAYSCEDGKEIVTKELKNYEDAIGNWTYVYHWDNKSIFPVEFLDDGADHSLNCPYIEITPASAELIEKKQKECPDKKYPFDWKNAKLKLDAPLASLKDSVIVLGEKENWMVVNCSKMIRVVIKYVADDYIAMINPDAGNISELLAKKTPKLDELKCIAHNVDIGKGMKGIGLCY